MRTSAACSTFSRIKSSAFDSLLLADTRSNAARSYYMVMPRFGQGEDLFDFVEAAPDGLDGPNMLAIFAQVVDAVAFLHSVGIVHRDIKDENVILDGEGRVQLIDFGSAAYVREGRKFDTFSGTLECVSLAFNCGMGRCVYMDVQLCGAGGVERRTVWREGDRHLGIRRVRLALLLWCKAFCL